MSQKDPWASLVARLRAAQTPRGRRAHGVYSIEGVRLFERALRAEAPIREALVAESVLSDPSDRLRKVLGQLAATDCVVRPAPDEVVQELTEGRDLGWLLGVVALPDQNMLGSIFEASANSMSAGQVGEGQHKRVVRERPILVMADVEDPGNLGALIRTALASGVAACISLGGGDPFHPKAVRTSMGSIFKLPLFRYTDTEELFAELRQHSVVCLGAVPRDGEDLRDLGADALAKRCPTSIPGRTAMFVGNEAFGLSEEMCERMHALVSINMPAAVDSYSVNAAAAILLYQIQYGAAADNAAGAWTGLNRDAR